MPKRRIDPTTGKPQLTNREQRVIDEYIKNGGNGAQAAAAAGYSGTRPDQAAYRVLNRPEVQRRIRERIAQSRVSADEIIGTLVSIMYGRPGDLYDESGEFSILVAKQNGADHLLKSISGTTRTIEATKTRPAQVVKSYRAQIHSPLQAATALARILGINPKTLSRSPSHRPLTLGYRPDPTDFVEAIAVDFKVSTWLEDLIDKQMNEQGLSREAVAEQLLQIRPEIAKYLRELPDEQDSAADLAATDPKQRSPMLLISSSGWPQALRLLPTITLSSKHSNRSRPSWLNWTTVPSLQTPPATQSPESTLACPTSSARTSTASRFKC